jgi:hypothetical protein
MAEREGTKCFRTYRIGYCTDEEGLTEECLQQNVVSFLVVENTLLKVTIKLISTSTTTNNNQHSLLFIKADPK